MICLISISFGQKPHQSYLCFWQHYHLSRWLHGELKICKLAAPEILHFSMTASLVFLHVVSLFPAEQFAIATIRHIT